MTFSDEQLTEAWKKLPEVDRLMLYLIDVEQLGLEKVAVILGVPAVIVEYRTVWVRTKLKEDLLSWSDG